MNRDDNIWVAVGRFTSLAFILPASTFAGYLIGYLLDRLFHTRPYLSLAFLILGIVAGFVELIKELQKNTDDGGR